MTETMEKAHHTFFSADGRSPQDKAQTVMKSVKEMMERPEAEFYKEMYRVPATFSITAPAEHTQLASMIEAEMPAMDYYLQNKRVSPPSTRSPRIRLFQRTRFHRHPLR